MDWTLQHSEELQTICQEEILKNQPPMLNGLEEVTVWLNGVAYPNVSRNNITLPYPTQYSPEYLRDVEYVSCEKQCSGHGSCDKGKIQTNKQNKA